jgi:hypothetical protein
VSLHLMKMARSALLFAMATGRRSAHNRRACVHFFLHSFTYLYSCCFQEGWSGQIQCKLSVWVDVPVKQRC